MKQKNKYRKKISVVEYAGYNMVYPGQAMLQKINKDKSKTQVYWGDISPDQTYKRGNWKITIEFESYE